MKIRIPQSAPSLAVSFCALFVALGGASYAAVLATGGQNNSASAAGTSMPEAISSGGEHFLNANETHDIGTNGHFTFSVSCREENGENVVSFKVISDMSADMDGTGPQLKGNRVTIHTDSDALDSTPENPLKNGQFVQTESASSSTEIAADGEEVDIFYNDGVNWNENTQNGHDCFAGYNGIRTKPAE